MFISTNKPISSLFSKNTMQYHLPKPALLLKLSKAALSQITILLLLTGISYANNSKAHLINFSKKPSNTIKTVPPIVIKGKVTDRTSGETLIGVSIKIKNTSVGTVTDVNGNFEITAPDNAILVVSYIGYDAVEVPVNGKSIIGIQLKPSSQNLNEVVVVGYGTQKKTSTTASVSTLKAADIVQKPVVNLTNDLVGRVSGLVVTQGSGEPGQDGSNILIRGIGSYINSSPLYVVDGVPRDFSRLDPNTIETLTVLKDAAAVAPYGVAGANGVILVTTKRGKIGAPSLSYNAYYGTQNPTKVPTFVNSYDYATLRNEANANDGNPVAYSATDLQKFKDHSDPDGHPDGHPLQDIIKLNRPLYNHNVTLSGGTDKLKYFTSVGYTHQAGMWDPTYLDKYNAALNVTADVTKTTKVSISINGYNEGTHYPGESAGRIIEQAQRQAPTTPIYYSNGLWTGYIGQSLIGEIYHSGYQYNEKFAIQSQFTIEQQLPIKGLSIKGVISYDPSSNFNRGYHTPIPFYNVDTTKHPYVYNKGVQGASKASFNEYYEQNHAFTYQGFLNYQKSIGKSEFTALGVAEYRNEKFQNLAANRLNYNLNVDELSFGGPAAADATNGGSSNQNKQLGFVYRFTYAYNSKYFIEAAGRYDGNFLFGPGNRFGFFPAFSAGWRVSEEKFIKDNFTWINNLKIRASYGQSGALVKDQNGNLLRNQYLSNYLTNSPSAVLDGSTTQGAYEALQGNPNITWERAKKSDVGFEASLWNGTLGIEADYFSEKRSNILADTSQHLPPEYGVGIGRTNAGAMSNHGVDITVRTSHTFSSDLRFDMSGTFTYARNTLTNNFETGAVAKNPNRSQTGKPLGTYIGLQAIGYFTPADFNPDGTLKTGIPSQVSVGGATVHPGDLRYADINGDGKITVDDQVVIGHPNTPEIIYGLEPHLTFKNFDLDLLIQGSGNSSIYLNGYYISPFSASGSASQLVVDNHWTPTNTNALYPRLSGTPTSNNTQGSSWYVRNDSYVRLKSFELGYTFSNKVLHNKIQSLRVYFAGQNVLNFTPHMKEIIDPENNGNNRNYYQQRVLSVGINTTF